MAVAVDTSTGTVSAAGSGTTPSVGPQTCAMTVGNNPDRYLEGWVSTRTTSGSPATVASVTWTVGATVQNFTVHPTLSFTFAGGLSRFTYVYLFAPTVGAGTIAMTPSASSMMNTSIVSLYGRSQSLLPTVEVSGVTGTGTISVSVPDTSGIPFVTFGVGWGNIISGGSSSWTVGSPSDTTVARTYAHSNFNGEVDAQAWTVVSGSNPYTCTLTAAGGSNTRQYGYAAVRHSVPVAASAGVADAGPARPVSVEYPGGRLADMSAGPAGGLAAGAPGVIQARARTVATNADGRLVSVLSNRERRLLEASLIVAQRTQHN